MFLIYLVILSLIYRLFKNLLLNFLVFGGFLGYTGDFQFIFTLDVGYFNSFKYVEICFVFQNMISVGE